MASNALHYIYSSQAYPCLTQFSLGLVVEAAVAIMELDSGTSLIAVTLVEPAVVVVVVIVAAVRAITLAFSSTSTDVSSPLLLVVGSSVDACTVVSVQVSSSVVLTSRR